MKAANSEFCLLPKKFAEMYKSDMMKFENQSVSSTFIMPKEVEKHIKTASSAELRVILHIFARGGKTENEAEIAAACGIGESEVYAALAFWRGTGIITYQKEEKSAVTVISDTKPSEKSASYSSAELAEAIETNEDIRSLLNFASQKVGKILTPGEQARIYSLVDVLSMDCDLVMGIIEYCTSNGTKSIRYIERTAAKMYEEDGIDTYAKFEEYIARKTSEKSFEAKVRKIIGAKDRAFTKRENEIIAYFAANGISEDLIEAAYERTIKNLSKPSLPYMSKIIESWKSQGISSAAELEGQKPFSTAENKSDSFSGAFSLDDFTEKPGDDFDAEASNA